MSLMFRYCLFCTFFLKKKINKFSIYRIMLVICCTLADCVVTRRWALAINCTLWSTIRIVLVLLVCLPVGYCSVLISVICSESHYDAYVELGVASHLWHIVHSLLPLFVRIIVISFGSLVCVHSVEQKGSKVVAEWLRFDFAHDGPVGPGIYYLLSFFFCETKRIDFKYKYFHRENCRCWQYRQGYHKERLLSLLKGFVSFIALLFA